MAIKIAAHVIIGTVVYTSEIKLPEDKLSRIPCSSAGLQVLKQRRHPYTPVITKDNQCRNLYKQMTFFSSFFFNTEPCILKPNCQNQKDSNHVT